MIGEQVEWPVFSQIETRYLLSHFDEDVFDVSPTSHFHKFITALTGDAGAGDVLKQTLISRLNQDIKTTWFEDLDSIFGNILGFPRLEHEAYSHDPMRGSLTAEEMTEVMLKDAWYKARIQDLLQALQAGSTVEGIRGIAKAVLGHDADVYESWQFRTWGATIGRISHTAEREIIVVPQVENITQREKQVILHLTDRVKPVDTFVTVDHNGLPLHTELKVRNCAADSSYFEVRKRITNTIDMDSIPAPEFIAEDLYHGQKWLYETGEGETTEAPQPAFSTTMEHSQYYVFDQSSKGQISKAEYLKLFRGEFVKEKDYTVVNTSEKFTEWQYFELADSPDNYPGGREGQTPMTAPAVDSNGDPYRFPYRSQAELERELSDIVINAGGEVQNNKYRLPLSEESRSTTYVPHGSLHPSPPKPGALTSSWYSGRSSTRPEPSEAKP